MMSTILAQALAPFSSAVFSDNIPTNAEPYTLPGWQALLLVIVLVTVLVLALYWNTKAYQASEADGSHGSETSHTPEH